MATSLAKQTSWRRGPASVLSKLDAGVLFAALLAILTFQLFRSEHSSSLTVLWLENIAFLSFPVLFSLVLPRIWTVEGKEARYYGQIGAAVIVFASIGWQIIARSMGYGDANEIFSVIVLQHLAWFLAVFCWIQGFEKICLVLCSVVVFFVCCMTERTEVFVLAGIFGVASLWGLAGLYWNRLNQNALDGQSEMLPIRSFAIGGAVLAMLGIALLIGQTGFLNNQIDLHGFSPFSGGEGDDQHELARKGVGDGHMLTAGKDPTTTGPVESDQFIQDHLESMYDVTLEKFDGPVFKRPRNRSVAIDEISLHMHEVKQSEQAGRSFRTMRESKDSDKLKLESKTTEALFYVEGSVPARFAIDTFHRFDGWDWKKSPIDKESFTLPRIQLQQSQNGSIYQLAQVRPAYLTDTRKHRIKIMRLKSNRIPAPSFMDSWHIAYVNDPKLFAWGPAGLVEIDGVHIATHTMIDVLSYVPNFNVVREEFERLSAWRSKYLASAESTQDLPFQQMPETGSTERLRMLADEWLVDVEPGWAQVEEIVRRVRTEFELNPDWEADSSVTDTVSYFLDQKGGPSYMFATTCALMLRSIGFDTRITKGYAIDKSDYDRVARQTVVTGDHLHFWPEVTIDGRLWIPLEPTPGFAHPYSTQTFWNRLSHFSSLLSGFVQRNPIPLGILMVVATLAYIFRKILLASAALVWWHIVRLFWPQKLLQATRQVLDLRFTLAGLRRPPSSTLLAWYSIPEPTLSTEFFELWNTKNYSDKPPGFSNDQIVRGCRETLGALSFSLIKNHVSSTRKAAKA